MHILETPRLTLRPPSHSDELLVHGLHSDPFVVNAIGDGVYPTIEQSKAELLQLINHWRQNRFGIWMVFVKDEAKVRKFAGYSGLKCSGLYLPEGPNNVESVTCLHGAASGKGIGVEASRAVVQFAFEYIKLAKVNVFILKSNTRSLIKNLKVGCYYVGETVHKNKPMRRFEISATTAVKSEGLHVFAGEMF
ncbi:GNAT family N-acetyltransferase [Mesorhizobium sp. M1163]|uniref:GNAT family N-acetyltransferase n=1 Tax=Mesorhizobium sp. M1163 TaxID=2957065 RepID=UPI003338511C